MGFRNLDQAAKGRGVIQANVPQTSGQYAEEVITFGPVGVGDAEEFYRQIGAVVHNLVAGASVELWLAKVTPGGTLASDRAYDGYVNSSLTPLTTQAFQNWVLPAWPGAQIRVKSGGTAGVMGVSASGY